MLMLASEIVHKAHAFQPRGGEQVPENVLERFHFALEPLEHLRRGARTGERRRSFKHPAFDALFLFLWRKICERQEILRFEVCTLKHEFLPPLVIDQPGNRIRECPLIRVARSTRSYGIASYHPATAKAQGAIEPVAQCIHLRRSSRYRIRPPVGPASH